MQIAGHLLYLAVMTVLALSVSLSSLAAARDGLVVLGIIGLWRYSWAATNLIRAWIYQGLRYPKARSRARAIASEAGASVGAMTSSRPGTPSSSCPPARSSVTCRPCSTSRVASGMRLRK